MKLHCCTHLLQLILMCIQLLLGRIFYVADFQYICNAGCMGIFQMAATPSGWWRWLLLMTLASLPPITSRLTQVLLQSSILPTHSGETQIHLQNHELLRFSSSRSMTRSVQQWSPAKIKKSDKGQFWVLEGQIPVLRDTIFCRSGSSTGQQILATSNSDNISTVLIPAYTAVSVAFNASDGILGSGILIKNG